MGMRLRGRVIRTRRIRTTRSRTRRPHRKSEGEENKLRAQFQPETFTLNNCESQLRGAQETRPSCLQPLPGILDSSVSQAWLSSYFHSGQSIVLGAVNAFRILSKGTLADLLRISPHRGRAGVEGG